MGKIKNDQFEYKEQIRRNESRITAANVEIQRIKNLIAYQDNRSRQARTIIERGF